MKNFMSISNFIAKYPSFKTGGIRHLIYTNQNDFNKKVVKKMGRKILLDEQAFLDFVNECPEPQKRKKQIE